MKKSVLAAVVMVLLSVFVITEVMAAESGKMETATGKVTSVDPQGKAISLSAKMGGKGAMDVGAIVNTDTIIKVKGKKTSLDDIKVGDTVTLRYLKSDDLYAKEIIKK